MTRAAMLSTCAIVLAVGWNEAAAKSEPGRGQPSGLSAVNPAPAPLIWRDLDILLSDGQTKPIDDAVVFGVANGQAMVAEYDGGVYTLRCPDEKMMLYVICPGTSGTAALNLSAALELDVMVYLEDSGGISAKVTPGANDFTDVMDVGAVYAPIVIISEVVDATLPGGLPKFVELTNCGDVPANLGLFSIGNFNNGGTNLGGGASVVLSGILAPGESYVVSYENNDSAGVGTFFDTYGFDPDNFDLGAFINGDDVMALFLGPATGDGSDAPLVDVYGVIGTDGTGEAWEYTDGHSTRLPGFGPNAVFDPAEWDFGGADSLETGDDVTEMALILAETTPGTHTCVVSSNFCAGAMPISGTGLFMFDNSTATTDGDPDPLCGNTQIDNDVWYCWTAPCTGVAIFETCGLTDVDTKIAAYDGCTCPAGAGSLACKDDGCMLQSRIQFPVVVGGQYLLRVGTFPGSSGGVGQFSLSCNVPAANDICEGAEDLVGYGEFPFNNTAASTDGQPDPLCDAFGTQQIGKDVWFCWTSPCDGEITIRTCNLAEFDTKIAVYDQCECLSLRQGVNVLACNDDACGLQSSVTFNASLGNAYLLRLGSFPESPGGIGAFRITGSCPSGACCMGSVCVDGFTAAYCADLGGSYQGDSVPCDGGLYYAVGYGPPLEDISGTGTVAPIASTSDDDGDFIDLPFDFCFFENTYNSIGISSNGFLTFGTVLRAFENTPIPFSETPNDLIAPYWDDWNPSAGGTVVYETLFAGTNRFVVQWTDVPHFGNTGASTFQAALFADGAVEFRYGALSPNSPSVGIEDADGTAGIEAFCVLSSSTIRYEKVIGEPVVCAIGACCYDDGCVVVSPAECDGLPGGNYLGDDTDCTPDAIDDPGLYVLHNDPDNSQAPPPYGLRLDELINVTEEHDVFTFDFDAPGATMYLCYDGTTVRIYGTAYGGRDRGLVYDAAYSGWVWIDFLYDTGVGLDPLAGADAIVVDAAAGGQNSGTVMFLPTNCCLEHIGPGCEDPQCETLVCDVDPSCCDADWEVSCAELAGVYCVDCSGDTYTIYDYPGGNPYTFRFGENGVGFNGGTLHGAGWLVHPNPDSQYILANDWAFTGVPYQAVPD